VTYLDHIRRGWWVAHLSAALARAGQFQAEQSAGDNLASPISPFASNPEISTDLSSPRGKIQSNYPTFHATYTLIPSKSFGVFLLSI
jgi:hypothetical protein